MNAPGPWPSLSDFEDEVTLSDYRDSEIAAEIAAEIAPDVDHDSAQMGALVALVRSRHLSDTTGA